MVSPQEVVKIKAEIAKERQQLEMAKRLAAE